MNPLLFPPSRLARSVRHADSDERLTELARTGSNAAFEAIVARHRRSLVRLCARIVGDTDAEEAVQNAMLSAHLALVRGDRVENLGAWLRAICHNAALNILRARAARPECSDEGRQLTEAHDDPAGRREQLGELVAAVQSLPQRQRHAIVMRELEGRSYEEIAHRLGATNGAVRQLLNRARATVRDRLAVLPGLEPLVRWLSSGSNATTGALAGGCTLGAKLCASALVPAVIAGGGFAGIPPPASSPPRHRAARSSAAPASTAAVVLKPAATHPSRSVTASATALRASPTRAAISTPRARRVLRSRPVVRDQMTKVRIVTAPVKDPSTPKPKPKPKETPTPTQMERPEEPSETPQQAATAPSSAQPAPQPQPVHPNASEDQRAAAPTNLPSPDLGRQQTPAPD